jgi:hypothetical protein
MKKDRYLDEKKVSPTMHYDFYSTPKINGMLAGHVDGELVVDKNQRAIPYKKIGKLEGKKQESNKSKIRRK